MFISFKSLLIPDKFFKQQPVLMNELLTHGVRCLKMKNG